MIWGVGTGRCGTSSLASFLGGLHEPEPWLKGLPARYAAGELDRAGVADLRRLLRERAELEAPAIVDLKHSYCMDLIEDEDPGCEWYYIARDPAYCVGSLLSGGSWTEKDRNGTWKLYPRGGWAPDATRVGKAAWYWTEVNERIMRHIRVSSRSARMILTEELGTAHHLNRYPDHLAFTYTREEARELVEVCGETWAEVRDMRFRAGPGGRLFPR